MTTTAATFYDRAAAILARGFSTIRLNGKLPLTRNGAKDRSRDPIVIARWTAEFPQANAAIVADDTFIGTANRAFGVLHVPPTRYLGTLTCTQQEIHSQ
jgi:hypothetical protein